MESDLGYVVGNLVKPQAAFTFRTTTGDGVPLNSEQKDKHCNKAEELASVLLCSLRHCFRVCAHVCVSKERGIYESSHKVLLRRLDHCLPCLA